VGNAKRAAYGAETDTAREKDGYLTFFEGDTIRYAAYLRCSLTYFSCILSCELVPFVSSCPQTGRLARRHPWTVWPRRTQRDIFAFCLACISRQCRPLSPGTSLLSATYTHSDLPFPSSLSCSPFHLRSLVPLSMSIDGYAGSYIRQPCADQKCPSCLQRMPT